MSENGLLVWGETCHTHWKLGAEPKRVGNCWGGRVSSQLDLSKYLSPEPHCTAWEGRRMSWPVEPFFTAGPVVTTEPSTGIPFSSQLSDFQPPAPPHPLLYHFSNEMLVPLQVSVKPIWRAQDEIYSCPPAAGIGLLPWASLTSGRRGSFLLQRRVFRPLPVSSAPTVQPHTAEAPDGEKRQGPRRDTSQTSL